MGTEAYTGLDYFDAFINFDLVIASERGLLTINGNDFDLKSETMSVEHPALCQLRKFGLLSANNRTPSLTHGMFYYQQEFFRVFDFLK